MKFLEPTRHPRLNEAAAVVFLLTGLFFFFSLASYHPFDPSLNTASEIVKPANLTGRTGALLSDFLSSIAGARRLCDSRAYLLVGLEADLVVPDRFGMGEAVWRRDADRLHVHGSGIALGLAADRRSDSGRRVDRLRDGGCHDRVDEYHGGDSGDGGVLDLFSLPGFDV